MTQCNAHGIVRLDGQHDRIHDIVPAFATSLLQVLTQIFEAGVVHQSTHALRELVPKIQDGLVRCSATFTCRGRQCRCLLHHGGRSALKLGASLVRELRRGRQELAPRRADIP